MVPKHFWQAYSRMLHLKKKRRIRDSHLTNITNKQAGKDRQCTRPTDMVLKSVKTSCCCSEAKDICETVWLLLKSTYLIHPCTPRRVGTPLENSGTPWRVRYTRLTITGLDQGWANIIHRGPHLKFYCYRGRKYLIFVCFCCIFRFKMWINDYIIIILYSFISHWLCSAIGVARGVKGPCPPKFLAYLFISFHFVPWEAVSRTIILLLFISCVHMA